MVVRALVNPAVVEGGREEKSQVHVVRFVGTEGVSGCLFRGRGCTVDWGVGAFKRHSGIYFSSSEGRKGKRIS